MIFLNYIINYLKYIGIFIIFIISISFVTSLINLTNVNYLLINKLSIILTGVSFFIVTFMASKNTLEKGFILGTKLSLLFVLLMIILNLIIFKSPFNIDRVIYYLILICSGTLGGSIGKNFKKRVK